ncbi:hypothetical protein KQI21_13860 [Virgibacillus proomii]|uniref:DUF7168 domain-containing protein n=1 Tax=Virgibacillus proomii TaxID=84407 RepID=UPI001C1164B4|nr:hypothetical protein [Virgibacillus proomii]MBU5267878.1 hypothetical protein [Virgibacillus proomii]
MLKHDVSMSDIALIENKRNIDEGQVTVLKKLYWWERELAIIISKNFRVQWYMKNRYLNGERNIKRAIIFFGYETDVALAKKCIHWHMK